MSDLATQFHETWLGMVQPVEGLVVSLPVLVDAQCLQRQPPRTQTRLVELCPSGSISNLETFLAEILGLTPDLFDPVPEDLSLYVPEGRQTIRPTMALRGMNPEAGRYMMLVWDLPDGLPFDKPETATGPWDYPPAAKFDRLLRHTRVPIGLLTNRRALRLFYAPHGEFTGTITFKIEDMATVGGRPILDAFVMLLSATRFFGVLKSSSFWRFSPRAASARRT